MFKVGDLVKITTARDPRLVGTVALVVGFYKTDDVLELRIPSRPNQEPSLYHITRLEKVCK